MNEKQRNALKALADSNVDILGAVVEQAYADSLGDVLTVDSVKGEEAKAKVKTLVNEMVNTKVDFERKGLDTWYKCICEVIEEDYQDAGLTDQNPMTIPLAQKWVNWILHDLSDIVDIASLDEGLKGNYSFQYYKEFVETFRDCFPPVD